MAIDTTLDKVLIPNLPTFTPEFGTKKTSGGLSTQECAEADMRPFTYQRPIKVTATDSTTDVERHCSFLVTTSGITLTIKDATFEGCEARVLNTSTGSITIKGGTKGINESTSGITLAAGTCINLVFLASGWRTLMGVASTGAALLPAIEAETSITDNTTLLAHNNSSKKVEKKTITNIWTYIQNKISSVLGLTATQYNGNAKTSTTATNATNSTNATQDGNGNNIVNTYATKTDLSKADSGYTYVVDSNTKLDNWAKNVSGNDYSHVLIKRGTWTCSLGSINLSDTKTVTVTGEKGSTIVFSAEGDGLGYSELSEINYYKMYNVTVKAQSTGGCFTNCWNLEQCIAENGNKGFYWCNHLSNCIAYNCFTGFNDCRYIENCKAQFYDTSCKSLVNGFYYCYAINTCYASVKTGDKAIGFSSCRMVSTSHASVSTKSTTAIKFGFSGSSDLQGCNGSFGYCEYMVNCAGVNTECVSVVNHKDSAWSM